MIFQFSLFVFSKQLGRNKNAVPTSRRDARERRALKGKRSTNDVNETQSHERDIATGPISRWCAFTQFEVLAQLQHDVTNTTQGERSCLLYHETVENDARALLLTNARHGFHNRARYWRGDGDASQCFSKEIVGISD